jgi:hypothetical protein
LPRNRVPISALYAALFVLVCTAIGWLVGYPLVGLLVGLGFVLIAVLA